MDLLNALQLVDLQGYFFLEELEGFDLICLQEPLKFFLLVSVAVLVDELKHSHRDYLVDQGLSLLLAEVDLLIQQFLK